MKTPINIFWFRRDLRLDDNAGLFHALINNLPVLPIFIFDQDILVRFPKKDARVDFIFETLQNLRIHLEENYESSISIYYGNPLEIFKGLITQYTIDTVFTNHDYEPYALLRDNEIREFLSLKSISFKPYKDQVIFEKDEIVKNDGTPYMVYTPYMKKWKSIFHEQQLNFFDSKGSLNRLIKLNSFPNVTLNEIGFEPSEQKIQPFKLSTDLIDNYEATRNFPAIQGTSHLGPHLRFGTVSIRKMVHSAANTTNEVFWQELIWREFFMQILWHFPHTKDQCFKPQYDRIQWRNNETEFQAWCEGKTGYPLVDAGMRELNSTGFMHNRVRMLVGSFLCKHLLIDWRWGEAYFALKLHDYEMSSNVGNWQWVAGCGVDASPYFRIFNPTTQIEKFDKELKYINKWVIDLQDPSYPSPIVDHKYARERCLKVYKDAIN